MDIYWMKFAAWNQPQAAHQAFERILYVYKTENMSIRRMCASFKMIQRDLLSTECCLSNFALSYSS